MSQKQTSITEDRKFSAELERIRECLQEKNYFARLRAEENAMIRKERHSINLFEQFGIEEI